jgi:acetyl esterase/lipase
MEKTNVRQRPPELQITDSCQYTTIHGLKIGLDYYVPEVKAFPPGTGRCRIMLFVHGGAWIGGNRKDYSRPLFHSFISKGYIVVSIDYRLLPESTIYDQTQDIEAAHRWCREELYAEVEKYGVPVDVDDITWVGASAGAHLVCITVNINHNYPHID